VGVAATWAVVIDESGHEVRRERLPEGDRALRRRLLLRNPFHHGSMMIRRDALVAAGGYRDDYGHNEDYDLWRRIARSWELAAVPEILYGYRIHHAAVTRTDAGRRVAERERLRDELWREPALAGAVGGEHDRTEALALAREAMHRRRPLLAARSLADALKARPA
jgi:hypothetical protein